MSIPKPVEAAVQMLRSAILEGRKPRRWEVNQAFMATIDTMGISLDPRRVTPTLCGVPVAVTADDSDDPRCALIVDESSDPVQQAAAKLGASKASIPGLWNAPGYPELTTGQMLDIASRL